VRRGRKPVPGHALASGARSAPRRARPGERAPGPGVRPRIGVLSLQGDFSLHAAAVRELGGEPVRVSLPSDLRDLAALILPGGESTTMLRLLDSTGLREPVERAVRELPVLGTCAGLILLAREADRLPRPTFDALDITVERNAWGRQVDSFTGRVRLEPGGGEVEGVFIRAPRIRRVGTGVETIARLDGEPVGVRQGRVAGFAFHPELTPDRRLHAWFLRDVAGLALPGAR
jgi:5'-phosphate synthase pdxT subunit